MAEKKILILLATATLMQSLHCETVQDVLNDYKPKIDALRDEVLQAMIGSGKGIGDAKVNITNIKTQAKATMEKTLRESRAAAEAIAVQASSKDLESCVEVKDDLLGKLDTTSADGCDSEDIFQGIYPVITEIRKKISGVYTITSSCQKSYPKDAAALRNCLDDSIASLRRDVGGQYDALKKGLGAAVAASEKCAEDAVEEFREAAEGIVANFANCVGNA